MQACSLRFCMHNNSHVTAGPVGDTSPGRWAKDDGMVPTRSCHAAKFGTSLRWTISPVGSYEEANFGRNNPLKEWKSMTRVWSYPHAFTFLVVIVQNARVIYIQTHLSLSVSTIGLRNDVACNVLSPLTAGKQQHRFDSSYSVKLQKSSTMNPEESNASRA